MRVENLEIKLLCTVDFMIREGGMRRNRRTTARLVSHTSPRNRFTAERSSVSEENKGRALGNLGIILSFSPPSALPPAHGKLSHPFTKGSEVPPDLTAVRFLAPLISSSTMPPSGRVKVLVFLPFRKPFFTEERESEEEQTHTV